MVAGLVAVLAIAWTAVALGAPQRASGVECRDTNECRQLALDAAARGAYERFHDLVWRAIQTGRPDDPELLYLLARAQSLSNRPHDALVVLRRLVAMGVVFDAATNEDLSHARSLPGWRALEGLIAKVRTSDRAPIRETAAGRPAAIALPTAGASGRGASAAAPAAAPLTYDLLPIEEALRFSAERFVPGGLAYDAVSARFIFGSVQARTLFVVGDGSSTVTDLARAESAGFHDVAAIEIDRRRGDLWVVSTAADGGTGVLHKLQLISGRSLAAYDVFPETSSVRLVDVAVTPAGTVLVLDSDGRRVFALRPGARTLEPLIRLDADSPGSLASTEDERTAYVAVPAGLVRLDIVAGTTAPLAAPRGIDLQGIERLRWHSGSLVAVQALPDGTRRIVSFRLNRTGRAVAGLKVLNASIPANAGPTFATIVGDDLYYLVTGMSDSSNDTTGRGGVDAVVHRMRLE